MRYIQLFLLAIPFLVVSQEINDSFLESLPDEVKEQIKQQSENKKSEEDKIYRSIDSSAKLEKEDTEEEDESIKIFGEDFFSTIQSSFMPVNEPNLDDSYILDFGDALSIQLIGSEISTDIYQINRAGSINLPNIGKIYLSGITLEMANSIIQSKVQQAYLGTEAFVTLTNIRDVSVLVSGNALNPGVYTLNGNSSMLHAISIAGGINEFGSYREILLIRDNEIIETLDIYDLLMNANFSTKTRLRSGDVVFVEKRKNLVQVSGAFNRPHIYELNDNQTLNDAVEYSYGLNSIADTKNIHLKRVLNGEVTKVPIWNLSQLEELKAKDGDHVFIREHNFREVTIYGSVMNPSSYLMTEGDTIFDLIKKAGGYTKNANPYAAVYESEEVFEINKMAKDLLYQDFMNSIITMIESSVAGDKEYSSALSLAENLKDIKPSGRIVIDLLDKETDRPLLIKDKDVLFIPEKNNNIYIYGEVHREGVREYSNGKNVEYYITESAGLKDSADNKSIYVLYPNGTISRVNYKNRKNLFSNQVASEDIPPGSIIFVPRKVNQRVNNTLAAQAYATILGQIGVSLASLSVLKE